MAGAGGIFGGLAVGLAGGMGGGGAEGGAMTGINGIMSAAAKFGRQESHATKPTIDSLPDKVRPLRIVHEVCESFYSLFRSS